jgi:3alpha(or 20beta)-hydroxysteroid dehydrogenase
MSRPFSLEGRVAIVTGAASGIGQATASRLAQAGARVVALDIEAVTWDTARRLAGQIVCDVSKERQVAHAIEQTMDANGRLDILVNNAGVFTAEPVDRMTSAALRRNFDVNFGGVVWGIKYASRVMAPGSAIVNTASHAGLRGVPNYGAYAASKAAVIAYTKTAALDLAGRGIRVNCVCPGTVTTPMGLSDEGELELKTAGLLQPLGRVGRPEEIAAAIHFLASEDCGFITGHALAIDGGKTAGPASAVLDVLSRHVMHDNGALLSAAADRVTPPRDAG